MEAPLDNSPLAVGTRIDSFIFKRLFRVTEVNLIMYNYVHSNKFTRGSGMTAQQYAEVGRLRPQTKF
jgi:hypothetical protein